MSQDRELLERAERHIEPPSGGFAALVRRRARRERNRRLASAGVAVILAVAAVWLTVHGLLGAGTGRPVPGTEHSEPLRPQDVSRLQLSWLADVGPVNSSPVAADGRVYFGSSDGMVYAFAAECRSDSGVCNPLWIGRTDGLESVSLAVAGDLVYAGSTDGRLYAFPVSCGSQGATCPPRWTVDTGASLGGAPPVIEGGIVYVATDQVWAIEASTGALLWKAPIALPGGSASAGPVVPILSGDTLLLSTNDELVAVSAQCGANGGRCTPMWVARHPSSGAQPVVVDGTVYVPAGTHVLAYPVSCGAAGRACGPLWMGQAPGAVFGSPAVADGQVYVSSKDGSVTSFAVGCRTDGGECAPTATRSKMMCNCFNSILIASGGVLYVADDGVTAYPETCALQPGCGKLFTSGNYTSNTGVAVTNDGVYVTTNALGGHLYAFELPTKASASPTRGWGGLATTAIAILVYAGLLALAVRSARRWLRRRAIGVRSSA